MTLIVKVYVGDNPITYTEINRRQSYGDDWYNYTYQHFTKDKNDHWDLSDGPTKEGCVMHRRSNGAEALVAKVMDQVKFT